MKWRFCRPGILVVTLAWLAGATSAGAQTVGATRCGTGVHESEATGTVLLPDDQSFCALVADPKEPSTFISYLRGRFRTLDDPSGAVTNIATIGVGDTFGLVRFGGPAAARVFSSTSSAPSSRSLPSIHRRPISSTQTTSSVCRSPFAGGASVYGRSCITRALISETSTCCATQEPNARIYRSNRSKCSPPSR